MERITIKKEPEVTIVLDLFRTVVLDCITKLGTLTTPTTKPTVT